MTSVHAAYGAGWLCTRMIDRFELRARASMKSQQSMIVVRVAAGGAGARGV